MVDREIGPDGAEMAPITRSLIRMGLLPTGAAPVAGPTPRYVPLTGGVSSDIWRVDIGDKTFCVKRARARLKVTAVWEVPVARSLYEARWLETAGEIRSGVAPALLGHDREAGVLAMAFMTPADHVLWKDALMGGAVDEGFAGIVGSRLGEIHGRTAGRDDVAAAFDSDEIFQQIRLEPYLLATGRRHGDLAEGLAALARETAGTRKALVHGDVSPKNILMGPDGPVFLDAECAWYGDPAFDLAFCLNHLLLKCAHKPALAEQYMRAFERLLDGYGPWVAWEPRRGLYRRVARLLPALLLARVDGKSPVDYLTAPGAQDSVRRVGRSLLLAPVDTPGAVAAAVQEGLRQ